MRHLQQVNPDTVILLVGIIPLAEVYTPDEQGHFQWPNKYSASIAQINGALQAIAAQHNLVHYVDCGEDMLTGGQVGSLLHLLCICCTVAIPNKCFVALTVSFLELIIFVCYAVDWRPDETDLDCLDHATDILVGHVPLQQCHDYLSCANGAVPVVPDCWSVPDLALVVL